MVKLELTPEMIEGGRRMLERLDAAKFRARACFWMYDSEAQRWRFVVASPEVRTQGPLVAYRKIDTVARRMQGGTELFGLGDVTVKADNDPFIRDLRAALKTGPGIHGVRVVRNRINGTVLEDAFIYRARAMQSSRP